MASTPSVFLVTFDDGDYYTRYPETLAAFSSRQDALDFALCTQVAEVELWGRPLQGLAVVERAGDDEVSSLPVVPQKGIRPDRWGGVEVIDLDAVYSDLGELLSQ